jgi:hypothetical protein
MRLLLAAIALLAFLSPDPAAAKPRRKPKKKPAATKPEPPPEPEEETEPEPEASAPAAAPGTRPGATPGSKPATGAPQVPVTQPAPTPPPPTDKPDAATVDVESLRKEYLALRDQLFRSRARAAALGSALYSTRIRLHLDYKSARFYTITRAVIRLDGASVFDDTQGAITKDKAPRFDGFIAPGRHLVTVRIEAAGKDDQRFTTALESSFVVQAPGGKDVIVRCTAEDDGDIAYQWQKSEEGSYKLRLDVGIDTQKREGSGGSRARR